MLATKKKCQFLQPAVDNIPPKASIKSIEMIVRSKEDSNAANYEMLLEKAGLAKSENKHAVGVILKERETNEASGGLLGPWEQKLSLMSKENAIRLVDVATGLAFVMSIKDEHELDLLKKSSVLSNKVMKHGCVKKLEDIVDSDKSITHEALATYIEEILEDPSKISLNVPKEDVQSCYFPIIQSGGNYELKVSAQSTDEKLSHDVILVSLGARYRSYCSNISRTFLVDPPKKISDTYSLLLQLQEACLDAMKTGNQLKEVYKAAVKFLKSDPEHEYLVDHLPKNLGFATGMDFRETNFLLTPKNTAAFKKGMVFCLSVGFQNLTLKESDVGGTSEKAPVSSKI